MKRYLALPLLVLAACGTPQEQCISAGTRDLRVVDRLIAESEGNLKRGYGYQEVTVYMPRWLDCTPRATEANPNPEPQMCLEDVPQTSRKPVALDLAAEASKLKGLRAKRAELAKAAERLAAECRAKYPE